MQDPTTPFPEIKTQFPEQEQLKCPRCESTNTKFCYYNNYNLSQPRHFCKNCRRYWTKGGALRNIPVGGGTRKSNATKRASNPKRPNPDSDHDSGRPTRKVQETVSLNEVTSTAHEGEAPGNNPTRGLEPERRVLEMGVSFSSLLGSGGGQFGNLFDGSGLKMDGFGEELNMGRDHSGLDMEGSGNSNNGGGNSNNNSGGGESYLRSGGEWGNSGNGWSDLAIYTPGSTFQ